MKLSFQRSLTYCEAIENLSCVAPSVVFFVIQVCVLQLLSHLNLKMVKLHFSKRSLNPYHFAIGGLNESDLELLAGTMEGLLPVAY